MTKINKQTNINPWWITGITDGDGTFSIIAGNNTTKSNWAFRPVFQLAAANNPLNLKMLEAIKTYFGVGYIQINTKDNTIRYRVISLKHNLIIQKHFKEYPLMTTKLVHFTLWSEILELKLLKEHLTETGLTKIVGLKALFPNSLSPKLIKAFPNYTPALRPAYLPDLTLMNLNWIAGFINADGTFGIYFSKDTRRKGENMKVGISITQNNTSILVLERIREFLSFGNIWSQGLKASAFGISSIKDANLFIAKLNAENITFQGSKSLDYEDFCLCISLINNKEHLTELGLLRIKNILRGMNTKNRTVFV